MVERCIIVNVLNRTKPVVAIIHRPSLNCQDLLSGCLELLFKVATMLSSLVFNTSVYTEEEEEDFRIDYSSVAHPVSGALSW